MNPIINFFTSSPGIAQEKETNNSEPLRLYLHPEGNDNLDGLTPETSILTLSRAHEILVETAPNRDVEIRIHQGTYYGQKVVWTWTNPNHTIKFMPADESKNRPIFDGCLKKNASNTPQDCPGGTWLRLKHSKGEGSRLDFSNLYITRYQTAISLEGSRDAEATSNGSNRIFSCYFKNIGNGFAPHLRPSTAAVRLVNSDDNVIINNYFINIINKSSQGLIHALYIAHMSDRNKIIGNRFENNSGDPIRIRDFSNDNLIQDNQLLQVGIAGGTLIGTAITRLEMIVPNPLPNVHLGIMNSEIIYWLVITSVNL